MGYRLSTCGNLNTDDLSRLNVRPSPGEHNWMCFSMAETFNLHRLVIKMCRKVFLYFHEVI